MKFLSLAGNSYDRIEALLSTMLGAVKDDIVNMRAQEFENFLQHPQMLQLDRIPFFNEPPLKPSNII